MKQQALVVKVTGVEALLDRAWMLSHYKLYQELVDFTGRILKESPDNAAAWFWRANALGNVERYEDSLKAFDRSIELNPGKGITWNDRVIARSL